MEEVRSPNGLKEQISVQRRKKENESQALRKEPKEGKHTTRRRKIEIKIMELIKVLGCDGIQGGVDGVA